VNNWELVILETGFENRELLKLKHIVNILGV